MNGEFAIAVLMSDRFAIYVQKTNAFQIFGSLNE